MTFNTIVTRENFEQLLDDRRLQAMVGSARWWTMRRNGATQKWKRDARRIRVPFKVGLRGTGAITECNFNEVGVLDRYWFRAVDEVK
jgi:hypothetical protein